jgi:hypothetical protein
MNAELTREPKQWYESHDNLADLYAYLKQCDPHTDFEYMLRKPWKWADEFKAMQREREIERLADEADAFESEGRYS